MADMKRDLFHDEEGFTTVGMVLALLITIALVFSAAQVYRVNSASADVQDVADAAALAAENEVAEFMIVVRVCDAIVLSLSLTGIVATGLGIAALCTPATAAASEQLIAAGRDVLRARDTFADKAAAGLNRLQKLIPFLATACAASVASSNDGGPMSASYLGLAVLVPVAGEDIVIGDIEGVDELAEGIDRDADDIRRAAEEAERAAQKANAEKERAFKRDCGDDPAYCMYERAYTLAGLTGENNPRYNSVDTWSFSVPLARAQAYYAHRLAHEKPQGSSVEEQAQSVLRQHFYAFASSEVNKGYVHETVDSFDAYIPSMPKNTVEMRDTSLYTDVVYPVTINAQGQLIMHAWHGCPGAAGSPSGGSIAHLEQGGYTPCPHCGFSAASMGKVAAASTSIDNGFEYHYEAVAQAAKAYQKARAELDPLSSEVKGKAGGLIDRCMDVLKSVGGMRIDVHPPGRYGAVAFVVNVTVAPASTGFASGFVRETGSLGMRAAVSAATLLSDPSGEGKSVLSSLLDGFKDQGGAAVGVVGVVLDCWSGLLYAYLEGQEGIETVIEGAIGALPFASASGLGSWAAATFEEAACALGLQPAKLDALKPVIVNSAHVASAGDAAFSARFIEVKQYAHEHSLMSTDLFSSLITEAEVAVCEDIVGFDGSIEIAMVELLGEGGPSVPITIVLPPEVKDMTTDFVSSLADGVRSVYVEVTGVRIWE